jgi:hypothetical protein
MHVCIHTYMHVCIHTYMHPCVRDMFMARVFFWNTLSYVSMSFSAPRANLRAFSVASASVLRTRNVSAFVMQVLLHTCAQIRQQARVMSGYAHPPRTSHELEAIFTKHGAKPPGHEHVHLKFEQPRVIWSSKRIRSPSCVCSNSKHSITQRMQRLRTHPCIQSIATQLAWHGRLGFSEFEWGR